MLQLITHIITGYKVKGYLSLFSAIIICLARNLKLIYQNVTHKPCAFFCLSFKYVNHNNFVYVLYSNISKVIIIVKEIQL